MMIKKTKKVFVALSGGVDSSVAALLLKKQGYDVYGVFMRNWSDEISGLGYCPADRDLEDARRVAAQLGIPFMVFNFEKEYKERVLEYFFREYQAGLTPNPDVMCNKEIKFGLFLREALKRGADYIATGHYVRLWREISNFKSQISNKFQNPNYENKTNCELRTAKDKKKDQTYFLWTLTQEQLKYCFFPIGDYLKSEVRKIAKNAGLTTASKKDSQGICFVGPIKAQDFLKEKIQLREGDVFNKNGEKLGTHEGVWFYTIGQRAGLNNLKPEGEFTRPRYVVSKDINKNILVVGYDNDLYGREMFCHNINWIIPDFKNENFNGLVRIRHGHPLVNAKIFSDGKSAKVIFNEPQRAITPGQSAVFYLGGKILGGGVISEQLIVNRDHAEK